MQTQKKKLLAVIQLLTCYQSMIYKNKLVNKTDHIYLLSF